MKSFLVKDKKPTIKWGNLPDEHYFEGEIPQGYSLAICPSDPYVILDIDMHGDINGFDNIPHNLYDELFKFYFNYPTKNKGRHFWLKYTGDKQLMNKSSGLGIDLRTSNGYVVFYPAMKGKGDIRDYMNEIDETTPELNLWLEKLFTNNIKK